MSKIITIDECGYCKYSDFRDGIGDYYCRKEEREISDIDDIPDWCPLEDAK